MQHYSPEFLQYKAPLVHVVLPRKYRDALPLVCTLLTASINSHSVHRSVWDDSFTNQLDVKVIFEFVDLVVPYSDPHPVSSHSHSALSPFNSSSDLFPNGVLSCRWFNKYTHLKPCVCVQLFIFDSKHNNMDTLVSEIEAFKAQCARAGSSPFVILAADGDLHLALSEVPAKTNLPRLAVLHAFCDSPTLKHDCEILVNTLLSGVHQCARPFYMQIESRIKHRSNKYYTCPLPSNIRTRIQLTPKFLECRNLLKQAVINLFAHPENATTSTQLFELAYQDLLLLLSNDLDFIVDDPNISDHDIALHHQIRTLLDVTAFHIVRGLFSLHRPLDALQAHNLHMSAVGECCKPSAGLQNWKAIQYEWLGQFMSMLPSELLLPLRDVPKSIPSVVWSDLGELMVPNALRVETIPVLAGWMFVRASDLLESIRTDSELLSSSPRNFLFEYTDFTQIVDKGIDLMRRGIAELDSDARIPKSVVVYLSWKLSRRYTNLPGDSKLARTRIELVDLYKMCSNFFQHRKAIAAWHHFQVLLLQMYQADKNTAGQLLSAVQLSMGKVQRGEVLPQCLFEPTSALSSFDLTEIKQPVLSADIAICGPSNSQACVLGDPITIQLSISSNLSISRMLSIAGDRGPATVVIESIEIHSHEARHESIVKIEHSSDFPHSKVAMAVDSQANLEIPSCEFGKCKIVCSTMFPSKIGRLTISLALMTIKIGFGNFELTKVEEVNFTPHFAYSSPWFGLSNGEIGVETRKVSNGLAKNYIDIGPVAPSVTVGIDPLVISNIIFGEVMNIPAVFSFSQPALQSKYEKIVMAVKLPSNSDQLMRLHWAGLKDDEPLDLMTLTAGNGMSCDLIAALSMPPHMVEEPSTFDFELIMQYVQQGHTYQQLARRVNIPVLPSPCSLTANIIRSDNEESDWFVELQITEIAPLVRVEGVNITARSASAGVSVAVLNEATYHPEKHMAVCQISFGTETPEQRDCRLAITSEIVWVRFGKRYTFSPTDIVMQVAVIAN